MNSTGGGTVSITKHDAGTWSIKGASNYTGNTTINAGTLRFEDAGTVGAGGGNVANNGTFQVYTSNTLGTVSGTGGTVVGNGTTAATVEANTSVRVRSASATARPPRSPPAPT